MNDSETMMRKDGKLEEDGITVVEDEKLGVVRKKTHKKRKKLIYETVRKQVEFYFSDANLSRDRFLAQLIQQDPNVPLHVFMKFNKIMGLVSSPEELAKALKSSEFLQVSEDNCFVRRATPIQIKTNIDECTIYVENIPADATHEYVSSIFSHYGKVVYVSLPKFHGTHTNKGFAFVEFDTPEEACKALEVFYNKGSCLPTHMPPDKLCSIQTHENIPNNTSNLPPGINYLHGEGQPVLSSKENGQSMKGNTDEENSSTVSTEFKTDTVAAQSAETNIKNEKDSKRSTKKRNIREVIQRSSDSTEPEGHSFKKLKTEGEKTPLDTDESIKQESDVNEDKQPDDGSLKKIRMKENKTPVDTDESIKQESDVIEDRQADDGSWKKIRMEEIADKTPLDTDESTRQESGATENKKRRKQKKKPKEDKNEVFADGLLVLSKKEWKRLRNKYLDMQKQKMKRVKARLYQAQSYYHKYKNDDSTKVALNKSEEVKPANELDTGRVRFSKGVIVKVHFEQPLNNVSALKNEAKTHSCVQYIDATPGCWEAFLRCSTPADALSLVDRQPWSHMSVLEGEEEAAYWEKIKHDRAEKVINKTVARTNERGKKKLLRKAEKMRGTHLFFN